jgi:DNA-binding NtrC family response regulator
MRVSNAQGTRLLVRPDGARSLILRRARLELIAGAEHETERRLDRTTFRIGTSTENDWVLSDETVSARHLELIASEDGVLLRDLGSKNGTTVDGLRVREIYLDRACTIGLGSTEIAFSPGEEELEIPISRATNFGDLLGHSDAMRAVFAILEQAAKNDSTLLLVGESGTGKELAARGVHERSPRSGGSYVVFDCGAASPTLIESQLFGHAKGAFTGATEARGGVFEDADGGTIVLDEIGELPLELQPKLLRVLESRVVQRLGESKPRTVDVRVVASTNRNLEEEARAGRFRQDLFFRLNVIVVRMPPLRERKQEIARLLRHFLTRLAGDEASEPPRTVLALAEAYDWPGNVRELRNFAERWATLPAMATAALLPTNAREHASNASETSAAQMAVTPTIEIERPFHDAKARWMDEFERVYLTRLLERHGGNISEVARVAQFSRQSCYRLLKKHGLGGEEPG